MQPPLPFERPGGTGPARRTALWSDGLPARLADAAGDLGTSADRLLLFLWTAFVGRLLGVQELLGGLAVDGRSQEVAETAGPFARVLPVAADLRPELSLRAGWQGFRDSLERSLLWQDCLSEPDLADGEGRLPLACSFTAETDPPAGARLAVDDPGATRLDLAYREEAGRALLTISHAEGAVDPALPPLWLGQLLAFVEGAVADPDRPLAQDRDAGCGRATAAGRLQRHGSAPARSLPAASAVRAAGRDGPRPDRTAGRGRHAFLWGAGAAGECRGQLAARSGRGAGGDRRRPCRPGGRDGGGGAGHPQGGRRLPAAGPLLSAAAAGMDAGGQRCPARPGARPAAGRGRGRAWARGRVARLAGLADCLSPPRPSPATSPTWSTPRARPGGPRACW